MSDMFRHIQTPEQVVTDIPNIVEELGLESAAMTIGRNTDYTVERNRILVALLGRIDVSQESVELTPEEVHLLFGGMDPESMEAVQHGGRSFKPRDLFNRIRELWATSFIEFYDEIGDLLRSEQSSVHKYSKKVDKSEKLINKKEVDLTETDHTGALGTIALYFANEMGVVENITGAIDKDLEMSKFVLGEYPEKLLGQLSTMVDEKKVGEDDYKYYTHPVDLFPKEWVGGKQFIRETEFKVKGKYDSRLGGWEGLAQDAHIAHALAVGVVAKSLVHTLAFVNPGARTAKSFYKLGLAIAAEDIQFTTEDIQNTIKQFREYETVMKNYGRSVVSMKKEMKKLAKKIDKLDLSDKDAAADIISYSSVIAKGVANPAKDIVARNVRVMRAMAYLINRMAKFAK